MLCILARARPLRLNLKLSPAVVCLSLGGRTGRFTDRAVNAKHGLPIKGYDPALTLPRQPTPFPLARFSTTYRGGNVSVRIGPNTVTASIAAPRRSSWRIMRLLLLRESPLNKIRGYRSDLMARIVQRQLT